LRDPSDEGDRQRPRRFAGETEGRGKSLVGAFCDADLSRDEAAQRCPDEMRTLGGESRRGRRVPADSV
jgi:hypothetical protein